MKDVLLLSTTQTRIGLKLLLYAGYLSLAMRGRSLNFGGPELNLQSSLIWTTTVLVHASLPWLLYWLRRKSVPSNFWWLITLIPSPMLLLCLIVCASPFSLGMWIGWVWQAAVAVGVTAYARVFADCDESDFAAFFAELANWACFSVLPLISLFRNLQAMGLDRDLV